MSCCVSQKNIWKTQFFSTPIGIEYQWWRLNLGILRLSLIQFIVGNTFLQFSASIFIPALHRKRLNCQTLNILNKDTVILWRKFLEQSPNLSSCIVDFNIMKPITSCLEFNSSLCYQFISRDCLQTFYFVRGNYDITERVGSQSFRQVIRNQGPSHIYLKFNDFRLWKCCHFSTVFPFPCRENIIH